MVTFVSIRVISNYKVSNCVLIEMLFYLRWTCVSSSMHRMDHHNLLLLLMEDRSQGLLSLHLVARRYECWIFTCYIVGFLSFSSVLNSHVSRPCI
jgi:hypothetical protein